MRREAPAYLIAIFISAVALAACGGPEGDADERAKGDETPMLVRARFTMEMRSILRDLKVAEEVAAVSTGGYVGLQELRTSYFNHPVPDTYTLSLSDVSQSGFRAEIVHKRTGLRCRLVVGGTAGPGRGVPTCS